MRTDLDARLRGLGHSLEGLPSSLGPSLQHVEVPRTVYLLDVWYHK
jgi:hypothetical protein